MNFSERVATFLKSLSGSGGEEKGEKKKDAAAAEPFAAEPEKGDINLDTPPESDGDEGMSKSNDVADATEILGALVSELKDINKSLQSLIQKQEGMEKSQADFGEAVVGVAEMVAQIAKTPLPVKGTMNKGALGNGISGGSTVPDNTQGRLGRAEFEQAQVALTKSFAAGRLSIHQCSRLESEMQKAMNIPGYQMTSSDIAVIARELKTA